MSSVEIVPFSPELKPFFESINKAWVSYYFSLEPFDIDQLENPEETLLAKGGVILFAKIENEIIGTVGLIPKGDLSCEMVKMGVEPAAQGKGAGQALGTAILAVAKAMGFKKMVLYSSTKLLPALLVYERLGFQKVTLECGAYGRCDIKMERIL